MHDGTVARMGRLAAGSAVLAVGALVLAGCGGGDSNGQQAKSTTAPPTKAAASPASTSPAQAPAGAIDACSLVTKAEVEAAAGVTVSDPKAETVANLSTCSFDDPAPPNFSVVDVSVLAGILDGDAQEVFDTAKKNGNDPQTVAGLGDDAFWDDVLGTLNVVKDNYLVGVDVASLDDGDRLTVAKTVAGNALGRLP